MKPPRIAFGRKLGFFEMRRKWKQYQKEIAPLETELQILEKRKNTLSKKSNAEQTAAYWAEMVARHPDERVFWKGLVESAPALRTVQKRKRAIISKIIARKEPLEARIQSLFQKYYGES